MATLQDARFSDRFEGVLPRVMMVGPKICAVIFPTVAAMVEAYGRLMWVGLSAAREPENASFLLSLTKDEIEGYLALEGVFGGLQENFESLAAYHMGADDLEERSTPDETSAEKFLRALAANLPSGSSLVFVATALYHAEGYLRHEVSHALWFQDDLYRAYATGLHAPWAGGVRAETAEEIREGILGLSFYEGLPDDTLLNEAQAYAVMGKDVLWNIASRRYKHGSRKGSYDPKIYAPSFTTGLKEAEELSEDLFSWRLGKELGEQLSSVSELLASPAATFEGGAVRVPRGFKRRLSPAQPDKGPSSLWQLIKERLSYGVRDLARPKNIPSGHRETYKE